MGNYRPGDRNVAQHTSQTVTATSDGTGTGQINDGVGHVLMGSNGGSANNVVTLPSHSMGLIVYITTAAGCELRVKTGDASKSINGEGMTNSPGRSGKRTSLVRKQILQKPLHQQHCLVCIHGQCRRHSFRRWNSRLRVKHRARYSAPFASFFLLLFASFFSPQTSPENYLYPRRA